MASINYILDYTDLFLNFTSINTLNAQYTEFVNKSIIIQIDDKYIKRSIVKFLYNKRHHGLHLYPYIPEIIETLKYHDYGFI